MFQTMMSNPRSLTKKDLEKLETQTIGDVIKDKGEEPRNILPESEKIDQDKIDEKYMASHSNNFITQSLNNNLSLYKCIHTALVEQSDRISEHFNVTELVNNNVRDIYENLIELNGTIGDLSRSIREIAEKLDRVEHRLNNPPARKNSVIKEDVSCTTPRSRSNSVVKSFPLPKTSSFSKKK